MRSIKAFPLGILSSVLLCLTVLPGNSFLQAQNSAVSPRITSYVDDSSRTVLHGNIPRLAQAQYDQGEASPSTPLTHIRLVLSRSSEQQAALDTYLAQLQDKSSPNYHKWLTPQQFGALYGPADSDIAAIVAWLESHGLQVEPISPGRTNIAFSGTVSQVEEAFHTPIHSFLLNAGQVGETQFYSNTAEPQIPSAIASVVKGVAHLNTIRPRPNSVRTSVGRVNSESSRMAAGNGPRANLTDTSASFLYIVPGDAATIYDTPNFLNANFSGSTPYTGAGVKIGIGGAATIIASIVGTYRSTFLGSNYATAPILNYCTSSISCSSTPASPVCTGTPTSSCYDNTDDADEAYLDTELSGGLAPGASIYYYASTDLTTGIEAALNANLVDIFSLSFGECESDMASDGSLNLINGYWEQAAGEGIAVTVSSGDSGSTSCDGDTAKTTTVAKDGLSVSGYASTIYNIAVGGTDFYAIETSLSPYVSNTLGSSSTYYRTVLEYILESIWNDSITDDTTQLSENTPETGKYASIVAGSGGASKVYSRPGWQTGSGTFDSGGKRDIPDVSLMSGNGYDMATWLVCDDDTNYLAFTNSQGLLNCSNISGGYFDGFGGTSTAAPAFAGILALVQQKTGNRLGQAAQSLYSLYNGSHGSSCSGSNCIFHDVTVGNNSVPCTSGSANCNLNAAGHYFESGYNASTGYDMASGMGSVDATQLVNNWSSSTGTGAVTINVSPSPNPVTNAQNLTVTVSVIGSSGTPTGTVTLSSGTYTSGAQTLAASGTCTASSCAITVPAGSLTVGIDTLTVYYSGDSTYAAKTNNSTTVTVTQAQGGSGTYTLTATSIASLAPGATTSNTSTITVSSTNGYAGTVTLTCALTNYPSGAVYLPTCSGGSSTVTLSSATTNGMATVIVSTTAASATLNIPKLPGRGRGWEGAGGGMVLAFLLFLGVPARRRSWRSMLGVLVMMAALGSLAACGGGTPTNTGTGNSGTTAGTYTFTVTGTGTPPVAPAPTTTFTVSVT
jgi:subtilase family serine protease